MGQYVTINIGFSSVSVEKALHQFKKCHLWLGCLPPPQGRGHGRFSVS